VAASIYEKRAKGERQQKKFGSGSQPYSGHKSKGGKGNNATTHLLDQEGIFFQDVGKNG